MPVCPASLGLWDGRSPDVFQLEEDTIIPHDPMKLTRKGQYCHLNCNVSLILLPISLNRE